MHHKIKDICIINCILFCSEGIFVNSKFMKSIIDKINRKKNQIIRILCKDFYTREKLYRCYWHKGHNNCNASTNIELYMAPGINHGAGIGHQISCWNSGYWLAKEVFNLKFAHKKFWINGKHAEPDDISNCNKNIGDSVVNSIYSWDILLGLGDKERDVDDLKKIGYKIVRLPHFNADDEKQIEEIKHIISNYNGESVVFQLEVDQMSILSQNASEIKSRFWQSQERKKDFVTYSPEKYNIAVHIRRGDVDEKMQSRFRTHDYFLNAIDSVLGTLSHDKLQDAEIFIFSEGSEEDFIEYKNKYDAHLCINMDAKSSFLHLIYADALVISPSGFSANAAAIGNAVCYCPREYKYYVNYVDWHYLDNEGKSC